MSASTQLITTILSYFTAAAHVGIVVLVLLLLISISRKNSRLINNILSFFGRQAILFSWIVALSSMVLSLYYSDIVGWEPCRLCWYQRIFIYPLVFIFGLALIKKDKKMVNYGLVLAIPGGLIALYHYFIQMTERSTGPCAADKISCAVQYIDTLGYISIPMMALTSFILIILFLGINKLVNKRNR